MAHLEIPLARVRVATRYHAAFPDEIDRWIAAVRVAKERERELATRERDLLG